MENSEKFALSYDLHMHSCLSPCGDNDMTPNNIAGMAHIKGLDIIALTDHNTCGNCPPVKAICDHYGIIFLPGMELTTEEEIHVVCLFDNLEKAMAWDEFVYEKLLPIENEPDIFGEQLLLNEDDETIGCKSKLLINATSISFEEVFALVEKFGGFAYPAHVDKKSNSLMSQLGFVPENSTFSVVEFHNFDNVLTLSEKHIYFKNCKVIESSDAHYLPDINEPDNFLHVEEKTATAVLNKLKSYKKDKME